MDQVLYMDLIMYYGRDNNFKINLDVNLFGKFTGDWMEDKESLNLIIKGLKESNNGNIHIGVSNISNLNKFIKCIDNDEDLNHIIQNTLYEYIEGVRSQIPEGVMEFLDLTHNVYQRLTPETLNYIDEASDRLKSLSGGKMNLMINEILSVNNYFFGGERVDRYYRDILKSNMEDFVYTNLNVAPASEMMDEYDTTLSEYGVDAILNTMFDLNLEEEFFEVLSEVDTSKLTSNGVINFILIVTRSMELVRELPRKLSKKYMEVEFIKEESINVN